MSSREAILAALKPKAVDVDLAAFGVSARVKMLTVGERDALMAAQAAHKETGTVGIGLALIVQHSTTDEAGQRLFADGDEGLQAVMALPAKALDVLAAAAMKLSGLSADAAETAEKN